MSAPSDLPGAQKQGSYDAERLQLCLDAAIAEAAAPDPSGKPADGGQGGRTSSLRQVHTGWQAVLRQVRRERLEERLRHVHDELLIDALEEVGGD